MAEKEVIIKDTKLRYSGTFDLGKIYKNILDGMRREGYGDPEEVEKSYLERVTPAGKQVEVVFEGKKYEADYFRADLSVRLVLRRMQDADVVKDGNKMTMQKGDIEVQFSSSLSWNVTGKNKDVYPDESLTRKLYERFLMGEKIEQAKIGIYKETVGLIEDMKFFLNLYNVA